MTNGPYLYDDGPEPLHTGAPRSRRGLLVAIFLGTALVAVAAAVALPLVRGSAGEQARQAAGVFVAALQQGDIETAYTLLCVDERARLQPGDVAAEYLRSGTARVGGAADADRDGKPAQRVEVRWTDGDAVARTSLTVVNEDGAHVCGPASPGWAAADPAGRTPAAVRPGAGAAAAGLRDRLPELRVPASRLSCVTRSRARGAR